MVINVVGFIFMWHFNVRTAVVELVKLVHVGQETDHHTSNCTIMFTQKLVHFKCYIRYMILMSKNMFFNPKTFT